MTDDEKKIVEEVAKLTNEEVRAELLKLRARRKIHSERLKHLKTFYRIEVVGYKIEVDENLDEVDDDVFYEEDFFETENPDQAEMIAATAFVTCKEWVEQLKGGEPVG